MPTHPTIENATDGSGSAPSVRSGRRHPRMRWVTAALVVVGVLGFAGVSCTPEEVAQIAVSNSFDTAQRDCALRIIKRESNYKADAISPGGGNIGLFQINKVHTTWIRTTYGYSFGELTDANKNAQVARGLSDSARSYYGDRWQPWRAGGAIDRSERCPA